VTISGGFPAANVAVNTTSPNYVVTIPALTNATLGNLEVNIILDSRLGNIGNIQSSGLNGSPTCAVSNAGGTNNVLDCVWSGPIPATATGTLTFTAQALVVSAGPIDQTVGTPQVRDTGSAQGFIPFSADTTGLITNIQGAQLSASKTHTPGS